jgi:glycosyltransferase involved in cell wall biosynthesis
VENDTKANKFGENGRKAVLEKYNWESEEQKLILFYDKLTKNTPNS